MRSWTLCLMILAAAAALAGRGAGAAVTIWSGVYTDAQAARGNAAYRQHCSYCHHDDLLGGEDLGGAVPPALVAIAFTERWNGKTVGMLFDAVSTTMPWRRASLTAPMYADIVAYLLKENGYPAGAQELTPDPVRLNDITITERR